jgi:hypothetical protein
MLSTKRTRIFSPQKGTKSAKKYPLFGFETYATFSANFWMLDTGCWMLDAGLSDPNAQRPNAWRLNPSRLRVKQPRDEGTHFDR